MYIREEVDQRALAQAADQIGKLQRLAIDRHQELVRKNAELQALICASPVAIVLTDRDGRISEWNPAATRILGYRRDDVLGRPVREYINQPNRRDLDECLERGGHFNAIELHLEHRDGHEVVVSASGAPVFNAEHHPAGKMWVLLDITEKKRAEETLRKSEKLASAGRMAAVIAHEINNPLEAISNLLYLIGTDKLSEQGRNFLKLAESELQRVVHIARQTLGFYRESNKPQPLRMSEVFDEVAAVYNQRMRRRNVTLTRDWESENEVLAFPGEIRQLFTNLISNAIEADATQMRVRVSRYREWKAPFRRGTRLTFSDNGKGIPAEARNSIFEPFFTTKGEKGTGLGLWVSRGIVHKYEGTLEVRSSTRGARQGTTFSVFFPSPAERRRVVSIEESGRASQPEQRAA